MSLVTLFFISLFVFFWISFLQVADMYKSQDQIKNQTPEAVREEDFYWKHELQAFWSHKKNLIQKTEYPIYLRNVTRIKILWPCSGQPVINSSEQNFIHSWNSWIFAAFSNLDDVVICKVIWWNQKWWNWAERYSLLTHHHQWQEILVFWNSEINGL